MNALSDVAADASRATAALAVSLGPEHAEALRALGVQLQESVEREAARSAASHAEALRDVTDTLTDRLAALPREGAGGELIEIVKEIRYDARHEYTFDVVSLFLLILLIM